MKKGEQFQLVRISDAEYEQLKIAEPKTKSVKVLKRIQAFKLMYLGWKYSAIAEFLSVTNNTITNWINYYREGGIDSLLLLNLKADKQSQTLRRHTQPQQSYGHDVPSLCSFVFI